MADNDERVGPSRWKDAFKASRKWIFRRDIALAAVTTVLQAVISLNHHHFQVEKWWKSVNLDYLWTFIGAVFILAAVEALFALATFPHRSLKQELHDHLKDHPHSELSAAPASPPILEIAPTRRGMTAFLLDQEDERVEGTLAGFIYVRVHFHASAGPDNPHPLTILRARAEVQLDDEDPVEIEGDLLAWFDEMIVDNAPGEGLPVVPPGHTAALTCVFAVPANVASERDPQGARFHQPASVSLTLSVIDSRNTTYTAREAFVCEVGDLTDWL